jgi:hypothetical protein
VTDSSSDNIANAGTVTVGFGHFRLRRITMAQSLLIEWKPNEGAAGGSVLTVKVGGHSLPGGAGDHYAAVDAENARCVALDALKAFGPGDLGDARPAV